MYVCVCYVDTLILYNVFRMDTLPIGLHFGSLVIMNYEVG